MAASNTYANCLCFVGFSDFYYSAKNLDRNGPYTRAPRARTRRSWKCETFVCGSNSTKLQTAKSSVIKQDIIMLTRVDAITANDRDVCSEHSTLRSSYSAVDCGRYLANCFTRFERIQVLQWPKIKILEGRSSQCWYSSRSDVVDFYSSASIRSDLEVKCIPGLV